MAAIPKHHTMEIQDYVSINIRMPTLPIIPSKAILPDPKMTKNISQEPVYIM